MSHAKRGDYRTERCDHAVALSFISKHHYAKGGSKTSCERFVLVRAGSIVGAALWMPPTRVCAESVHSDWRRVLSLSRLAVAPGEPTNAASLFLGAMIREIRRGRKWVALVTYADESQGHAGIIYRATNWTSCGLTKPSRRWLDADGRQVSAKATKTRSVAAMEAMGFIREATPYRKHKYTMMVNS